MRIAVSGTHCSGKSTLIHDFLATHSEYTHEPEPYESLEALGETFTDELTIDDAYRQLEFSVERWSSFERDANVIAERCPLDFVAYLQALVDLGRAARDCELMDAAVELTAGAMANVELLLVTSPDAVRVPDDEDPELREAMHECLLDLITTDPYSLLGNTRVVELRHFPSSRSTADLASIIT